MKKFLLRPYQLPGNRGNFTYNPVYATPTKSADFWEEFGESFSNIG
jgi:hypothetical protein